MASGGIFDDLLALRLVFLQGPLDGPRADAAITQILHLDAADSTLEITLHLNCASADLRAALALYDVVQTVGSAVRTICVGVAAGGAALVLAGGKVGTRAALPNARVTLYDARRDLTGSDLTRTAGDLDVRMREWRRLRQQVHELLARHAHQPLERIQRDAEREVWLSAAEARAYGLIDDILQPGRAAQDPDPPRS